MPVRLIGLPDGEIERLANVPRRHPFEVADRWVLTRLPTLRFERPGEYLYLNATTLVHAFGTNYKEAANFHYGPAGPCGSPFVIIWLKPR